MVLERLEQLLKKSLAGEKRSLVELLLSEVKVVVHRLHQGTEKVHARETYSVVVSFDGVHHLLSDHLTKAEQEQ